MKTMKKSVSILLAALMLATTFVVCLVPPAAAEVGTSYQKGDVIEYGSYPQTKVTDQSICTALESILYEPNTDAVAKSYNYEYNGGSKLNMLYVDLYYQGVKYRGVKIGQYRPFSTDHDAKAGNSYQDDNGYELNKWYFFKYEPLQWTVLDPDEGLVFCNSIIDAQPFHNKQNGNYPYEISTLKKWMDNSFYTTMIGGNYRLNEIEECRLLNYVDVWDYYNDITSSSAGWDCEASDYAFSQNYDNSALTANHHDKSFYYPSSDIDQARVYGEGWWTEIVMFDQPSLLDVNGGVAYRDHFRCDKKSHWSPDIDFHYPLYFAENRYKNKASAATFYANKDEDYKRWNFLDFFFDIYNRHDVIDKRLGLLTPSYYCKYSYHWADPANVEENAPVGDYKVTRGIRPVLKLKKLESYAYDNGYLLSSGANASTVVVETVGKGGVSGSGLKPEPVTGRQYTYLMNGQSVTLTATPNSGYAFDGWYKYGSDGYTKVSSNAAYTVTAQDHGYYKAQFKQTTQVRITKNGTGSGYVTCSKQSMALGDYAWFYATPDRDSYFVGWHRARYTGNGWYSIQSNVTLSTSQGDNLWYDDEYWDAFCAEFGRATLIEKVSIKSGIQPRTGSVHPTKESYRLIDGTQNDFSMHSVSWYKINSDGSKTEMSDTEKFVRGGDYQVCIRIQKTSGLDRKLISDEVECLVDNDPNCSKPWGTHSGIFEIRKSYYNLQDYAYQMYVVTEDDTGLVSTGRAAPGEKVTFGAPTVEGSYFVGWFYKPEDGTMPNQNDTCYSTDRSIKFPMQAYDTRIAAIYEKIPPDCVVGAKPLSNFGGLVTGGGTYAPGTSITVTATPDEGYAFEGWYHEGNLFSTENPCELDVPGMESITLEAKFGKLIRLKKPTDQLNDGDWYFDADATYAALAQKMGVSVEELIAFTDSVFYNAIAEYDPDSGLLILRDANSSDPNDSSEFRPGDEAYEAYTAGVKQYKAPTQPDNPGQPDNPQPQPDPNMCHWCGKVHEGFFQKIIGFFHNILAKIFGNKY